MFSPLRVVIQLGVKLGVHASKKARACLAVSSRGGSCMLSNLFNSPSSHVESRFISLLCSSDHARFSFSRRTFKRRISCTVISGLSGIFSVVVSVCCVLLSVIVICSISFLRPACCSSRGDIFLCCLGVILSRRCYSPRPLLPPVPCARHTPLLRPCSCGYKASVPCELRALPCRP